jgi:hypothetical protein
MSQWNASTMLQELNGVHAGSKQKPASTPVLLKRNLAYKRWVEIIKPKLGWFYVPTSTRYRAYWLSCSSVVHDYDRIVKEKKRKETAKMCSYICICIFPHMTCHKRETSKLCIYLYGAKHYSRGQFWRQSIGSQHSMEPEVSLSNSQQTSAYSYPE